MYIKKPQKNWLLKVIHSATESMYITFVPDIKLFRKAKLNCIQDLIEFKMFVLTAGCTEKQ